ncbi:hypothetical protein A8E02_22175 [Burkholderia cenocepacia]|nr:hypothetical protein A8E02_22175 [Burkholderia cenocepacia]
MSSNSYVNLKIATCLVRYADDRLIDQRFLRSAPSTDEHDSFPLAVVERHRVLRTDGDGMSARMTFR